MGQSRGYFSSRALCFIIIFSRLPWWFRVVVKNLPARQETQVRFLCQEDPLEKGMATHSSTLAWRILWTEEPGRLQSIGLQGQTQLSDWYPNTHTHTPIFYITHKWPSRDAPIVGHILEKITVLCMTLMTAFVVFVYIDGIKSWRIFHHRYQVLEKLMMTVASNAATGVSCPC